MNPFRVLAAVCALALPLGLFIAQDGKPTATPTAPNMESITLKDIKQDVHFLASDEMAGRETLSTENKLASAYIKSRMELAGLKPGNGESWYQDASFRYRAWEKDPTLSIKVGGEESALTYIKDFVSAAGALPTAVHKDVPVVFAGYAINDQQQRYDDISGVDMKGKFAIVLRYAPSGWSREGRRNPFDRGGSTRNKERLCREAGALGMLMVTGPASHAAGATDTQRDLPRPSNAEKSPPLELALGDPRESTRRPFFHLTEAAADRMLGGEGKLAELQRAFDEKNFAARPDLKDVTVSMAIESKVFTKSDRNVLGRIDGEVDEWIVFGAHHDHLGLGFFGSRDKAENQGTIHNGADDNASGVSAILEIAEAIATSGKKPRRGFLFATFTGEEKGLLGAQWYVRHPAIPHNKVVAMINLDMIGRISNKTYTFEGAGVDPLLDKLSHDAAALFPELKFPTTKRVIPASDHWPFYSVAGVPVVFPFDGENKGIYHTTLDDPETINYDDMLIATKMLHEFSWRLSESKEYPTYTGPVKGVTGPDGKPRNPKEADKPAEPEQPQTPEKDGPRKEEEFRR